MDVSKFRGFDGQCDVAAKIEFGIQTKDPSTIVGASKIDTCPQGDTVKAAYTDEIKQATEELPQWLKDNYPFMGNDETDQEE